MPIALARYDDLLHHVYDSALAPARWPATLGAIAKAFDARRVALWTFMHGVDSGGICFTHNLDQNVLEAWAQVSADQDPFVKAAIRRNLVVDGSAYNGSEMVPRDQLLNSRLYRDLWVPEDIAHACFGIVFAGTDGRQLPTGISLYRSPRDLPFDVSEVEMLRRLLSHLSRSLGVMFHLQDKEQQIASSQAALDRLASGVVLVDEHGGVQFANAAAERLLRRGDHVRRVPRASRGSPRSDRLASASASRAVQAAFTKAVDAATRPYVEADDKDFFEAQLLPDRDGKPFIVMHAAPLGAAPSFVAGGASARAIVFFHELNGQGAVDPKQLCKVFGLTQAEAHAALQLLDSGSMQDMATRLGVSINTFKTQIKAAYAKTHTHRRANLLRLMLSLGVPQASVRAQ